MTQPTLPISIAIAEDDGEHLQTVSNTGVKVGGVELRLTDWSGWDDTSDVRANPADVPAGDGAYDDGPLFGARTIMLKGVAWADTPAHLLQTNQVFRRFLSGSRRRGSIVVTQVGSGEADTAQEALVPAADLFPGADVFPSDAAGQTADISEALRCAVRLGGPTTFKKTHPKRAEWSLSLYAADPRRYGAEQSAITSPYTSSGGLTFPLAFPLSFGVIGNGGRITATNNGDIPTGVRLELAGACVNPQIVLVETGERLALIDTIDAGVVIDTNTTVRSVLRNGAPYGWVLTSDSEFFQLPPGTSTLLFLTDSGSPTLTATWSDATP